MKRLFSITFVLFAAITAHAQSTGLIYQDGEHDNLVSVVANDAADELEMFPLEITLSNPTTPIRGIDVSLCIDDNTIRPWVYDDDEEEYAYDLNSKRTYKSTKQEIFFNTEEHPTYPGYLHILINDSRDFKLKEGTISTIYFDATKLSSGTHTIHVVSPMCSFVGSDFSSASYFCADQAISFKVEGGTITIVDGINSVYPPYPAPRVYDLSGRATTPVNHGIYIVDGKKIMK